ncbi:hypothetical protein L0V05_06865 [Tabrizicola sp. J26]|uniref:hypothetical protein n=1 Tax=Alitabrizicola rongguiensis TaxID=2909234 RepID=UPI001F1DCB1D|nr:hypothetical protein [Tabrizicola rongguiensis]MCF1708535.1 hypothetical protein [Tabrizicola rongguiensis]
MPLSDPELWEWVQRRPMPAVSAPPRFGPGRPRDRGFATWIGDRLTLFPENAAGAVAEYRRFLYLDLLDEMPAVPSKIISEIRGLHRHFWPDDFAETYCGTGRRPDRAGMTGEVRANPDAYARFLARYAQEFDQPAPEAFWPTDHTVRRARWAWRAFAVGLVISVVASLLTGLLFHQIDATAYRFNWGVFLLGLAISSSLGARAPRVVNSGEASDE